MTSMGKEKSKDETVEWHLTGKDNTFAGAYDTRAPSVTPSSQTQKEKNPRTDSWDTLIKIENKSNHLLRKVAENPYRGRCANPKITQ